MAPDGPAAARHYLDLIWVDVEGLASPWWDAEEAADLLSRSLARTLGPEDLELLPKVVDWVRRDIDGVASRFPTEQRCADALYDDIAAGGAGESIFRSGADALAAFAYPMPAAESTDWSSARFLGLANPWQLGLPPPGACVIDLGCGSGVDTRIAADAVGPDGSAVGIDLRTSLVRGVSGHSGPPVMQCSAARLGVRAGCADLVVANGLPPLMDLRTVGEVLAEIRRVLVPGGQLRFSTLVTRVASSDVSPLDVVNAVRTGKPLAHQYQASVMSAGYIDVSVTMTTSPFVDGFRSGPVSAAMVCATKPCQSSSGSENAAASGSRPSTWPITPR